MKNAFEICIFDYDFSILYEMPKIHEWREIKKK